MTIVSGAVAERMGFVSYLFVSLLVAVFLYPVFGHWAWGGGLQGAPGWLAAWGFVDFAGSTVVHGVGGAVALAALLVLGPREGRFDPEGAARKISGSNIPMSMLGVLLLWVGWIGFNGGSTLALSDDVPRIVASTMLAGGFGLIGGLGITWIRRGYPAVEPAANGALAGLVAITANCHAVSTGQAALIGAIGAGVMLLAQDLMERFRLDDAVGAVPVHLAAGAWGTLAVALFGDAEELGTGLGRGEQLGVQCLGIVVCFVFVFGTSLLLFWIYDRFLPLRVTAEEEHAGLNVSEHRETTEILDLLRVMDAQARTQDLSLRAPVEPFTEIGQLATHYNRVVDALERAAVEMRAIVKTAKDGIVTFARDSLDVLSVNPSAELIFGTSAQALLGQSLWNLVSPVGKRHVHLDELLRKSDRGAACEFVGRRADQQTFPVEVILSLAEVQDGWVYVGMFRDISDRKNLEDQLRQAQKMEAVGQLAGGIAHDFNNLLTIINGFAEVSLYRSEANSPIREGLTQILSAGERAAGLTRQLLAFSRRKLTRPELLDVSEVVQGVHRMLRRLIGADIELVTICRADSARVRADRGELEQVLMNLAVNARDAMPDGGKLVIETAAYTMGPVEAQGVLGLEPGEYVVLTVSDSGSGMDAETQTRIFEPFFTTKEVDKGTGLGLSVVYGIVTDVGGRIQVESEPEAGTVFRIYLPTAGESDRGETAFASLDEPATGNETILLVEDEERLCSLVHQVLEAHGYSVLEAHNGSEAIEVSRSYEGTIDLLLTDIVMPQMRGSELARQLAAERPTMGVLFMSGYSDEIPRRELERRGQFIQKPFLMAHLTRRIRELLDARKGPSSRRSGAPGSVR